MRFLYRGTTRDGNGRVIVSATVSVFLANSSTVASVYTTLTSTTAVNSVTSSATDGTFSFYHDNFDYDADQLFKIVMSKSGFTSVTYDYVKGDPIATSYTISTAKTITTYVRPIKGVLYTHSAGGSLAFTGGFEAGNFQVFSGFDTSDVTFDSKVDTVRPEWFGTNQTALQTALSGAAEGTRVLISSDYTVTSALTVTKGLIIEGIDGYTEITQSTTTADILQINTASKVVIKGIIFTRGGVPTAGASILFSGAAAVQTVKPVVEHCTFSNSWDGIKVDLAASFQFHFNNFLNGLNAEIHLTDTNSSDSEIAFNFFNTGNPGAIKGILIEACPGLRIVSNKILGYGYGIQASILGDSSPLSIVGNSLENQATAAIQFQQAVPASPLGSVSIVGNEIASSPIALEIGTGGTWAQNISFVGNIVSGFTTGINLAGGDSIEISGNQFYSGNTGILGTANATNVHVGSNCYSSVTTPISSVVNTYDIDRFTFNYQTALPADVVYWNCKVQFGKATLSFSSDPQASVVITLPVEFPTAILIAIASQSTGTTKDLAVRTSVQATTGFTITGTTIDASSFTGDESVDWIAIGY